jgi:hypothetical protein
MLNKKTTATETFERPTATASRPAVATSPRSVTQEQIARRAYEIYKSGNGGTPEDNWYRAERELRARA